MRAKAIVMCLIACLVILSATACAGTSETDRTSSSANTLTLNLLPDDTSRLEALDVNQVLGGTVPETMKEQFETAWESYSLGEDVLTIYDVDRLVRAVTGDGEILMLSGARIDFAGVDDWLADEDTNIEMTPYQGQELWGSGNRAMVILQAENHVIHGDTEAVKELLKVKARGRGSLAQDSEDPLTMAFQDAGPGWYMRASNNCDEFSSGLRACEAYSITAKEGDEDYLVDIAYAFHFRSEQRADAQVLDIEDLLDDRDWNADLEEAETDGTVVRTRITGDVEDFRLQWLAGYSMGMPPRPLVSIAPTPTPRSPARATGRSTARPPTEPAPTSTRPATGDSSARARSEASPGSLDHCVTQARSHGVFRGNWTEDCWLDSDPTGLYVKYFVFTKGGIPQIGRTDLVRLGPADDPRLRLRLFEGRGNTGRLLGEAATLLSIGIPPGTYTIEAGAWQDGDFSLAINFP